MRILTVTNIYPPDFIGGYELLCSQIVDVFRARGHQVHVLTSSLRNPAPMLSHVSRDFHLGSIYEGPVMSKLHPNARRAAEIESKYINAFNVHVLLSHLEKFAPDVVYLHNVVGLGGLGILGCLQHQKIPWVWQLGDAVPYHLCSTLTIDGFPGEEFWGRPEPGLTKAFSQMIEGVFVCCSSRLVGEIAGYGIELRGRVEVLPYWFHGVRSTERASHREGGKLRIASAGALGPHKGTDLLIETAAQLRDSGRTNFSLDLYGYVDSPRWQVLIDKLNLRPQVTLHGTRSQAELARAYRNCDLFAFPTWSREPFGVAPLEAAAQGCVPVLAQSCGIAEWMLDAVECLKAERSIEGFSAVFADAYDGKIDLNELGTRAANLVWRDFHIDAVAPRIERILQETSRKPRQDGGKPEEAYRLAILAENTAAVLGQETLVA
jgi:glycosyltransferase involved in cell wall biosynthesis